MKAFLHVFLMLFPYFVFGNIENNDYGSIRGSVFTSDGQPAAYVSVIINNTSRGTTTDDKGIFALEKIKPGEYKIVFTLLDFAKSDTIVQVHERETVFLNIRLNRTIAELQQVLIEAKIPKYVETRTSSSLRLNLPLIETPQNIVVTPNQLLADQGLVSITQAIRNVSGVEKTYGQLNDYSLIIRGTDATLNVFRNGVGGYWWNQQEDVAMVEKIEFVKGPAGFMVSLAEPGGIVNIVTKQPTRERIVSVNAGFGSFNLMRLNTDLGGPLTKSGKLFYRFVAGIHHQERAFRFGKGTWHFLCPALTYEFNQKTSLTAEFNYMFGKTSGNNDGIPAIDDKMFVLPRDFAVSDPATYALTVNDKYYRLHLKHDLNENWHLNIQAASVHGPWGGYGVYGDDNSPVTNDTLYRKSGYLHYFNYSNPAYAYVDGNFRTGNKVEHKTLFGIDYRDEGSKGSGGLSDKQFGLYIPDPDYYLNHDSSRNFEINSLGHVNTRSVSLYAQDHIKIVKKLIITVAGRLTRATTMWEDVDWVPEDERKISDTKFTPRGGLTWLITENFSVYGLYDQCFLPVAGRSFEHKRFEPVTGYNIEFGSKAYFFYRKLSLNLSIFDIVKNNLLTGDPVNNGYQIQIGQVVSKGIDFDITGNITPSIMVNANYEFVDAKVTEDNNPNAIGIKNLLTPDHRVNLWLQYKLPKGKLRNLSFSAGYQYTGERAASLYFWNPDKTKVLSPYSLFEAAVGYGREKFNISLNIYNITNINYVSNGYYNPNGGWRYTPGEPVNFRLSFGVYLSRHDKKPG